jgi:hypothetical protein
LTAPATPDTTPAYGPLLDEANEKKAFEQVKKLWQLNQKQHKRWAAEWRRNELWRAGQRFVRIVEDPNTDLIRISMPLGTQATPPSPNDCDTIIRQMVAILMADPPRPDAQPYKDDPDSREAAAFATRFLLAMNNESGLNIDAVFEAILNRAGTYASSFVEVCYDPQAGGLMPLEIESHPDATTEAEAVTGPPGAPPKPPVRRYVMPDGSLRTSSVGAKRAWTPKLVLIPLTGNHVRFLPREAQSIDECHGAIIAKFATLGALKARFPRVAGMTPDEQAKLCNFTLPEASRLLPEGHEYKPPHFSSTDELPPETLVLTLTVYYKSCPLYPYGVYAVFGGEEFRLHAQPWYATMPGPDGEQDEMLDVPIAQMRWIADSKPGNPYGIAPAAILGPMDEMQATINASAFEYLYKFSRPRLMLPMGTNIQPEAMNDPDRPILFNPAGRPEHMRIPDYPQMGMLLSEQIAAKMKDAMSLRDATLGIAAGSVRSEQQQQTLIEQSTAGMSSYRAAAEDCYERLNRLILQQARAWYTTPQLMRFQSETGAWQVREFSRVDLGGTAQVRVQRGTMTLLSPSGKVAMIEREAQATVLTPQEHYRLKRENLSLFFGQLDDPHVLRVKGQLHVWRQGPPAMDPTQPPATEPVMDPATGQPAMDPATGQPLQQAVDPILAAGRTVFHPLPVDTEPQVASVRHMELSRAVSESDNDPFPDAWKQALYEAYDHARRAAGVLTLDEQQQLAQQQAQQQQAESAPEPPNA